MEILKLETFRLEMVILKCSDWKYSDWKLRNAEIGRMERPFSATVLTRLSLRFTARCTCGLCMAILCAHVARSHVN